jgi:O-antigen/teichoic acid export membrane protein
MPRRWRLLLACLIAVLALFTGAAFALFRVPERLEAPLGLFLLCTLILAAWNLYRWITDPRHQVAPAPVSVRRRRTGLWRQLPWFVLQLAVLGFVAWVWAEDDSSDKPSLGLVLFLGTGLVVALTALPFIVTDVVRGRWHLWSARCRDRKLKGTGTAVTSTHGGADQQIEQGTNPAAKDQRSAT